MDSRANVREISLFLLKVAAFAAGGTWNKEHDLVCPNNPIGTGTALNGASLHCSCMPSLRVWP